MLKPSSKGFEVVELPKTPRKTNDTISSTIQVKPGPPVRCGYENRENREEEVEARQTVASIPHKEKELQAERNLIAELLLVCFYISIGKYYCALQHNFEKRVSPHSAIYQDY